MDTKGWILKEGRMVRKDGREKGYTSNKKERRTRGRKEEKGAKREGREGREGKNKG